MSNLPHFGISLGNGGLIPDMSTHRMVGVGKFFGGGMGSRPISLLVGVMAYQGVDG